jgi:hypothetical protein
MVNTNVRFRHCRSVRLGLGSRLSFQFRVLFMVRVILRFRPWARVRITSTVMLG